MPSEALLRVWDAYCCDGRVVLFRIGLATLHLTKTEILSSNDLQIVSVVRTCAKTLSMVDAVLKDAMDITTRERITPQLLTEMRQEIARQVVQLCEEKGTTNPAREYLLRECDGCIGMVPINVSGTPMASCVVS